MLTAARRPNNYSRNYDSSARNSHGNYRGNAGSYRGNAGSYHDNSGSFRSNDGRGYDNYHGNYWPSYGQQGNQGNQGRSCGPWARSGNDSRYSPYQSNTQYSRPSPWTPAYNHAHNAAPYSAYNSGYRYNHQCRVQPSAASSSSSSTSAGAHRIASNTNHTAAAASTTTATTTAVAAATTASTTSTSSSSTPQASNADTDLDKKVAVKTEDAGPIIKQEPGIKTEPQDYENAYGGANATHNTMTLNIKQEPTDGVRVKTEPDDSYAWYEYDT